MEQKEVIESLLSTIRQEHTLLFTAGQFYEKVDGVYRQIPADMVRSYIKASRFAVGLQEEELTLHIKSEVLDHIRDTSYISYEEFSRRDDRRLTAFTNGYIDTADIMETGNVILRPFDSNHIFTHQVPHRINTGLIDGCPEEIMKKHAPTIEAFLKASCSSLPLQLRKIGYLFLRSNPYKTFYVEYGPANAGKTTFINLLAYLVGYQNTKNISIHDLVYDKFSREQLMDKLLNLDDEIPKGIIKNIEPIKMLTGESPIDASVKFRQEHYTFRNYAKLAFAGNYLPKLDADNLADTAFFDRALISKYPNTFTKDPDFEASLHNENEIEALIIASLLTLRDLKKDKGFSSDAEANKHLWELEINPVARFIETGEYEKGSQEDWITKDELYNAYLDFCSAEGGEGEMTKTAFTTILITRGMTASEARLEGKKYQVYRGVRKKQLQSQKPKPLNLQGASSVICPTCGKSATRLWEWTDKWMCADCLPKGADLDE
jgi:phage/plasmid-associated DNA primase